MKYFRRNFDVIIGDIFCAIFKKVLSAIMIIIGEISFDNFSVVYLYKSGTFYNLVLEI